MRVGGTISEEIRDRGIRVGFKLEDIVTHNVGTLAHINARGGPHVGKYIVSLHDLQQVGTAAIQRALAESEVIIVDELGPMELHSTPFILAVEKALESPKHFVGTIHKRATHRLINAIRSNPAYQIIEVSLNNREQLANKIADQLTINV